MSPVEAAVIPGTWDEIEEKEFTPTEFKTLDNGLYEFYLGDYEVRMGKDSGREYVSARIVHEKDPDDVEEGEQRKYSVWENLHFTAKTIGNTRRILRVMGVDLSGGKGEPFEEGEVPDWLRDALDDVAGDDTNTFQARVRRKRQKSTDEDGNPSTREINEVVRWIDPNNE